MFFRAVTRTCPLLTGKRIGMYSYTASGSIWYRHFLRFVGIDPASGKYIYSVRSPDDFTTRQVRGESQWAMQLTFRYEF